MDIDAAARGARRENLERAWAQRTALLAVADLRDPQRLCGPEPFDRILVDAPCSATGVIRRHPDIKLLRRPSDIASFAADAAASILRTRFALLKPGGRLVYCTCSVLPAENEEVVRGFPRGARLAHGRDACGVGAGRRECSSGPSGVQLLPGAEAGTDGFYYACLDKTTAGT